MIQKWSVTIPELTGEEQRNVYLYLPETYEQDPQKRYPVLYMFDGHNVFFDSDATYGKCWGMKEYMDYTGTQILIVAVECNHSPDNGRLKEYTPFSFSDPRFGKIESKGKLTMDWFTTVLKPEIDRSYRTLPDREHTFLAGSSMGGLMTLYAILEYPQYFSRGAALSPSLWVAPRKLEQMIRSANLLPDTFLYMDYGELELTNHANIQHQFARVTSLLMDKGILLESRIVPGGTHCEASWEKQLPFFMSLLNYQ